MVSSVPFVVPIGPSARSQALLEAASVAGSTFAVAAVAAGVRKRQAARARYTTLARQGRFIRSAGVETCPDGTVTAYYRAERMTLSSSDK